MVQMFLRTPTDDGLVDWRPVGSGDLPALKSTDVLRVLGPEDPSDYGAVATGLGLAVLHGARITREAN